MNDGIITVDRNTIEELVWRTMYHIYSVHVEMHNEKPTAENLIHDFESEGMKLPEDIIRDALNFVEDLYSQNEDEPS